MTFTPWSLLSDAGLLAALLVTGTVLRARVRLVQRLMLPASVIAGFLGLALGPEGLGLLPFSDQLGTYASVLIVVVFACLALTDGLSFKGMGRSAGAYGSYSVAAYALQVGLGMIFALVVLGLFWDVPDGFGTLLFAGWAGGFGTAAALGTAFEASGWEGASSLGFTAATAGMLAGVVGGIILNNWGARKGHTQGMGRFETLPEELRTGLVTRSEERTATGFATTSPSSVEPLGIQICVVLVISAVAYGVSEWFTGLFPSLMVPVFALAFIVGLAVRAVLARTPAWGYVDGESLKSVSGTATDVLITCGIASIVPSFVADWWLPLLGMFALGLALCLAFFLWVAPRLFEGNWFEKAVVTWGWSTGAAATAIALLRMVDPKLKSGTLEEFGVAYIPVAPVETLTVTFVPVLVTAGAVWVVGGVWTAVGLVALLLPWLLGWAPKRRAGGEAVPAPREEAGV
ncbi:sodium/glutamate symporter [Streptomyces albidoflavus]|uniref:sodium/glutamate symporter n=1 Tax=Streptomyces albidoflavus TaxID=1886 RepID=UPI0033E4037E